MAMGLSYCCFTANLNKELQLEAYTIICVYRVIHQQLATHSCGETIKIMWVTTPLPCTCSAASLETCVKNYKLYVAM